MQFKSLKDKCEYYRSLGEKRLVPNGHIIMMLDGRSFSKLIKNKFEKPFDKKFVNMMNEVAKYLCENISGVKFAYVQSDEISIYIQDKPESGSFFDLRMTKLLSIAASMASSKFNQLMLENKLSDNNYLSQKKIFEIIGKTKLAEFDCKVWNVPNKNEALAWFLYRQLDCIRNSKQQAAQTFLPKKELMGLSADEQIYWLKKMRDIDWYSYDDGVKYGRLISKVSKEVAIPEKYVKNGVTTTTRSIWEVQPMCLLSEESERMNFSLSYVD